MPNCHDSNLIQDFILTEHNGPKNQEETIFRDSNIEKFVKLLTDHFDEIFLLFEIENDKSLWLENTFFDLKILTLIKWKNLAKIRKKYQLTEKKIY